jgi:hypothetical protein
MRIGTFPSQKWGVVGVYTAVYARKGLAIQLTLINNEFGEPFEEPLATLSVWLESTPGLGPRQFWAKTYSENVRISDEALHSGLFKALDRYTRAGWEVVELWELADSVEKF